MQWRYGARAGVVLLGWLAVAGPLGMAAGCAGTRSVRGQVVNPADVPVRAFPRVWIVAGESPAEQYFADAIGAHLLGDAEVRVVALAELEPARISRRIPPATVVILPRITFERSSVRRWASRPQTICGATGCYTSRRNYQYEVPLLDARLAVTVYDGPSAAILQRVSLDAAEEGRGRDDMRSRATASLVEDFAAMVDQRVEDVEVVLLEVELVDVQRAIAAIDGGDWSAGRRLLEGAVQAAETLPAEDLARVFYDLGMARLYDPATQGARPREDGRFRAAAEALEEANRLDPRDRYQEAMAVVADYQARHREVRQQQAAAEQNYRVGARVPEPPAAYHRPPAPGPTSPPRGPPGDAPPASPAPPELPDPAPADPAPQTRGPGKAITSATSSSPQTIITRRSTPRALPLDQGRPSSRAPRNFSSRG